MSRSAVEHEANLTEESLLQGRLPWLLVTLGLVVIIGWLALKAYNTVRLVQVLESRQAEVESLMEKGLSNVDPQSAEDLVLALRQDVVDLKRESAPFVIAAPLFGWLPKIGPVLSNASRFMEIADAGSEAAAYAMRGLKPGLVLLQQESSNESRIPALLQLLAAAGPDLTQATNSIDRLVVARAEIDNIQEMPWRVQNLLQQLDAQLPLAHDGLRLAQVLPGIMGSNGPRTYLILAQNEDELRPTGGFISGAGLLSVDQGRILNVSFSDAYLVDDWRNKPYDFPPQPFFDYMGMDIFLFRDSNFWADFPTSAEQAMTLYTYGQGISLDGAIAIDQQFVRMLLGATGPLFVSELDKVVNSENVIAEMRSEWGPGDDTTTEWFGQRKAFMGPLANALRLKLENELQTLDPIQLARTIQSAVDQRHLQLYMRDPAISGVLAQTSWDGRQQVSDDHDFLQVIDTSLGFNKTNSVIERGITYHVTLGADGRDLAELVINYRHTLPAGNVSCEHGTPYTPDIRYEDLFDDCYWNYVRVYAPEGSTLVGGSGRPVPAEKLLSGLAWDGEPRTVTDEPGSLAVLANFLLLSQGEDTTLTFNYQLPNDLLKKDKGLWHYALTLQKQAGSNADPVQVIVTLPPGSTYVDASPAPSRIENQQIVFDTVLRHDINIIIKYR